jgi:mannonate dehydratase
MKATPGRRNFIKLAVAGTFGSKFLFSDSTMAKASRMAKEAKEDVSKLKLSVQIKTPFLDEDLKFVKQLGIEYLTTWVRTPEAATYENYRALCEKAESNSLKVATIGNSLVHNMEEVTLNLPGRDRKIEEYLENLRNLGRAGIHTTVYSHNNQTWLQGRN